MTNLSFQLLFCILLVASLLYSTANENNYGTLEKPLEGEFRAVGIALSKEMKDYDYDRRPGPDRHVYRHRPVSADYYRHRPVSADYYDGHYDFFCRRSGECFGTKIEEMSHLRKCLGNFSLIWSEKNKYYYTYFSYGENRLTFNDGRLSLKESSSMGIKFGKVNDSMTIENDNLCGPKNEIHLYGRKKCALIVQNNVSLASIIFNQSKEIYDLKGIESNIQVLYISHNYDGSRYNFQWLPGNLNDSSFLALSIEKQEKVLLGVPLCGSIIGVNEKCFLEFDSVDDMNVKMNSLKEDKLNHDEFISKSTLVQTLDNNDGLKSEDVKSKENFILNQNKQVNDELLKNKVKKSVFFNQNDQDKSKKIEETNFLTQKNSTLNVGSNKTDFIKILPNPGIEEKNETLKILLIIIGSLLSVITIILFGIFIKMYWFKTHEKAVSVAEKNNGLVFKNYSPSDL